jgi:hypothetical protein
MDSPRSGHAVSAGNEQNRPPLILEISGGFAWDSGRGKSVGNVPLTAPRRSLNCRGFQSQGFFYPAVRFQFSERAPEFNSGLFVSEKRDSGVVLSLQFGFAVSDDPVFESVARIIT